MMDRENIANLPGTAEHYAHEPSLGLQARDLGAMRSHEWMHQVIGLLEAALRQLDDQVHPAQVTLKEATSLLRRQIDPPVARIVPDEKGRMLAWQVRKIRDYIDSHITGPVLVADLCALIQRSESHFSRAFKNTLGASPHAFLVRRRVELAAQCMLTTDASLSDIAFRCGFADQAHLSKHFRQATAETPAAWRRAHRLRRDGNESPVERGATASRSRTPPKQTP